MATIELNYNNIRQNAINLKERAQDIIAVVKNNAYNLNLRECVKLYSEAGINYFATTKEEECKVIRETLGKDVNIFLLNPTYDFDLVSRYNIEINIASFEYLKENLESVRGLTLQLEFAGSMRRAGAKNLEEVLEIIEFCKKNNLKLKGFWSHFSFADEFDGFYEKEKELVLAVLNEAQKHHDFEVIHLQNSASFLRDGAFEKTTHQRLGIILYGAMPYNVKENPVALKNLVIRNPITVYGEIINIVTLNKGECIGYSNSYIADVDKKVGVVNIGYGDGILRDRLKGKTCIIKGKERNIYSTMMSHLVVEIGEENCIGDRVYIYDDKQQLHDYTKYFGPNSVQLAALNYDSLIVKKIY
ncbi:alanine racemase [uncultured Gemella sp.]|uniref:alanine racemase n=1 Tax=uncultured Gemella sp. TaxID=254352 RepID=UPI0028D4FDFD|nr:alanine racemase [uncultured Gemella sp.]